MKKVVCISNDWSKCELTNSTSKKLPIKDNIYNVDYEEEFIGRRFYTLLECSKDESFDSRGFIPLDDYLEKFDHYLEKELEIIKELVNI